MSIDHTANAERARLIANGAKLRAEIEQTFMDAASWNENSNARKEGAEPIDPDADGKLRRIADGLDKMLREEMPRAFTNKPFPETPMKAGS